MLVALGSLAAAQSKGTQETGIACAKLLNYAATHPDATIFNSRAMILHMHSNAFYLLEAQERSQVGGIFFLDNGFKTWCYPRIQSKHE
jgi:hypothetical protein